MKHLTMVLVCDALAHGCQVQPLNVGVVLKFPSRSHHALLLESPSDVKIVCGKVGARSHNSFDQLLIEGRCWPGTSRFRTFRTDWLLCGSDH